ncbi:hypothetical protein KOW79_000445 [Hemibagrus wyckioides]|uniref:Uncharacterized protein n=1 Tax=Hemibagrus wyckioides TaxID=337641 RepID=A0A9D3ST51_9TELE|nr:hypothetical protein KOW79_000445 [Hemibagrus wyckioides]
MDTEKVTEVKELTPVVDGEVVEDDKDVEKRKVEETKEAEKGAEHKEEDKKEKEVKEEESNVCKPKSSLENIYSLSVPSSSKNNEGVQSSQAGSSLHFVSWNTNAALLVFQKFNH